MPTDAFGAYVMPVLVLVGGSVFAMWMRATSTTRDEFLSLKKDVETLKTEVAMQGQRIAPFWASLQSKLADALTRPTHKEMDDLLAKLQAMTITEPERDRLTVMLHETVADTSVDQKFRKVADLILVSMPLVLEEERGQLPGGEPSKELGE